MSASEHVRPDAHASVAQAQGCLRTAVRFRLHPYRGTIIKRWLVAADAIATSCSPASLVTGIEARRRRASAKAYCSSPRTLPLWILIAYPARPLRQRSVP